MFHRRPTLQRVVAATALAAAAAVAAVTLVRHVATYFFLFDDFAILHEASRSSPADLLTRAAIGFYRPLIFLIIKAEFAWFSWQRPAGYAAVSALLHCANAALVWGITRRLGGAHLAGLAAATLFLLSPWSAEGYFWLSAQFDLVVSLGVLGAVFCALSLQRAVGWRTAVWLGLTAAAVLVAAFSKENAVVLPALLVAAAIGQACGARPRALWVPAAMALLAVGAYLLVRQSLLPGLAGAYGSSADLVAQAGVTRNGWSYLRAFVTFPSYFSGPGQWPPWPVTSALVAAYAALGLTASLSRPRVAAACLASFAVCLAPVIAFGMLPGSSAGGRLLYLPAAWICVLLGSGAVTVASTRAGARPLSLLGALASSVLFTLSAYSVVYQAGLWRSATSMSASAVQQFRAVLDRDVERVHIPNLPFWSTEGPYVLKPYAFEYFYAPAHRVPAVTSRNMVLSLRGDKPVFARWTGEAAAAPDGPGVVLAFNGAVPEPLRAPLLEPSRMSVFVRVGARQVSPMSVSVNAYPGEAWRLQPEETDYYSLEPLSGTGPGTVTITPRACAAEAYRESATPVFFSSSPAELVVRFRCVPAGEAAPPFGFVDAPADPVVLKGQPIAFRGWVLDDLGVRRVRLEFVDAAGARRALGEASRGGFRPDVAARFPRAFDVFNDAWAAIVGPEAFAGARLPGSVQVLAEDEDGNVTELGRRRIQ